jgi:hypothetical protein
MKESQRTVHNAHSMSSFSTLGASDPAGLR